MNCDSTSTDARENPARRMCLKVLLRRSGTGRVLLPRLRDERSCHVPPAVAKKSPGRYLCGRFPPEQRGRPLAAALITMHPPVRFQRFGGCCIFLGPPLRAFACQSCRRSHTPIQEMERAPDPGCRPRCCLHIRLTPPVLDRPATPPTVASRPMSRPQPSRRPHDHPTHHYPPLRDHPR